MDLSSITPLLLTLNEEANLARTLAGLSWAGQIVIVDSNSIDRTADVAAEWPSVKLIQRNFDEHATQWNFGVDQVTTEWTLALDADFVCPSSLPVELESLTPRHHAYAASFRYAMIGQVLRGTLYPPRVVLFKTESFRFVQDGHTQLLDLRGAACGRLASKIVHDDRKTLRQWLEAQARYASLEADKLLNSRPAELGWKDRLRRGVLWAPPLTLAYCLFAKRLVFDGWPGIYYSLQRAYAELLLSLEILERRLRAGSRVGSEQDTP